ncbi:alcohol acyltransferase 9 [Impatiens glandulifera]|uniref:alcohol acyltransferase 9 n=1 Tax=Impatiens glandulifera TaxID=253017 RepID=UPI001FB12D18|nr:alcohol acyltransferase 9 [Impatiens glandulifera]
MVKSDQAELPDIFHLNPPILICPKNPTPKHPLYLSNLDDQKFLRFTIKYVYLYRKSVSSEMLKHSLSNVLVEYYPFAGRLRSNPDDNEKLEIDCNGKGVVFAEAFMDMTADNFLSLSSHPNRSWRNLLYRVESSTFLDVPPLVVQVTNLRCGGMILCTAFNHCLCDGIGTSQFLHAWAHLITSTKPTSDLPITPFHTRHVLKSRSPPPSKQHTFLPQFTKTATSKLDDDHDHDDDDDGDGLLDLNQFLQSQPIVPVSLTFTHSHILHLKRLCFPSLKCTTFDIMAAHTWHSWVKALGLSSVLNTKLLFSVNIRKRIEPSLPEGYYGNGFILGCAEVNVKEFINSGSNYLYSGVKLVQQAKTSVTDSCVRSVVDLLEDRTVKPDLSTSLVISQWSKLGLEDLDLGQGKPLQMGPLTSDIYCLFLPVVGEIDAVRILISLPEAVADKFKYYMMNMDYFDRSIDGLVS